MSPSTLTAGPRGRRVLLELAMMLDAGLAAAVQQHAFAVMHDQQQGEGVWMIAFGDDDGRSSAEIQEEYLQQAPTAADIAARLAALDLPEQGPSEAQFEKALTNSVAAARYWQAPDGIDVLTGARELRREFRRLAGWAAPHVPALWTAPPAAEQHAVLWREEEFPAVDAERWKAATLEDEERAARERPADVTANWSGTWWSFPDGIASSGSCASGASVGVPTGLVWTEDASGHDSAITAPVLAEEPRILTIENTSAWNTLCWDQPLEVTASRRHDWYRVSGLDTRWVIPDWALLAKKYDAVSMSVGAYLAGASHALTVDTGINTMIAGWGPGEMRWLNRPDLGEPVVWQYDHAFETWTKGARTAARG